MYARQDRPKEIIIRYEGDESAARQFPHGNAQDEARDFVRTQPHVVREAQRATSASATAVYCGLVAAAGLLQPSSATSAPRNSEQVKNAMKARRNAGRLSNDALYNLHELAQDSDFVHKITTYPDLEVIMYDRRIIATFKSLLSTSWTSDYPMQQITYDTTFNLGDFYVSVLLFRETEFNENPVIPLAFYIHERKLLSTHEEFFRHMKAVIPEVDQAANVFMVTDSEAAITSAIQSNMPHLKTFLCWNHVIQVTVGVGLYSLIFYC